MAYSSQSSSTAQEHATNPRTGDLSPHHNNILYMPITSTSVLTGQFPPSKEMEGKTAQRGVKLLSNCSSYLHAPILSYPILPSNRLLSHPVPKTYPNLSEPIIVQYPPLGSEPVRTFEYPFRITVLSPKLYERVDPARQKILLPIQSNPPTV